MGKNLLRLITTGLLLPIARIGSDPSDDDELRLRKMIGVTSVLLGGAPLQIGYGLFLLFFNELAAGWTFIIAGLLMLMGVLTFAASSRQFSTHNIFWLVITVLAPFLATLFLGGFFLSGNTIIWVILAPLIALITNRPRYALFWFLLFVADLVVVGVAQPYLRTTNNLPPALITGLFIFNTTGAATLFMLELFYFVVQNSTLIGLLHREQEKSDTLLLNILPKEIADILKNENRVIADRFDDVSILFADVVNFTPVSAKMTPTELVELLNEVFSHLDALVEKYGLEKIKTIGDCYMVAAGVPRSRPDHAHVLTRLALDMRDFVGRHEFRGQRLAFRIGLNSGPVIAGVIGRKKFSYDLWGDAVNIASRMESHGAGGFIQVTEATYELIKSDFICEPRGMVNVKGKGEMNVWYVLEKKA